MIKTFEQAYQFLLEQKVVTVFGSKKVALPMVVGQHDTVRKEIQGGWLDPVGCGCVGLEDSDSANLFRFDVLRKGSGR